MKLDRLYVIKKELYRIAESVGSNKLGDLAEDLDHAIAEIESMAASGALGAPPEPSLLKELLRWAEAEREDWSERNAYRFWQMGRVVVQIQSALSSSQPTGALQHQRLEAGERLEQELEKLHRYTFDRKDWIYGPVKGTFVRYEDIEELLAALRAEPVK